ncbi:uncharacterized protein LOC100201999 isoform X2 [Hydra vulgaris]|uniref:Uncharacterized protein LOC100201999 isoform X2 n=1 Tax=Hydra vulgaris TaxID=6087 RepID=A0ABM4DEX5_HYDVU
MTMALVQNPSMFLTIIDTADADCIAANYQSFGNVLQLVVQWVEQTERKVQTSEDDESEDNLYDSYFAQSEISLNEENQEQEPETSRSQQLSETSQNRQLDPTNRNLPQTNNQSHPQISALDLANALSFASAYIGQPSSSNQILSSEQVRLACEQVQALGITDESLIRRALSLSGGNLEAAINLIFEEIIQ